MLSKRTNETAEFFKGLKQKEERIKMKKETIKLIDSIISYILIILIVIAIPVSVITAQNKGTRLIDAKHEEKIAKKLTKNHIYIKR